MIVAAHQTMMAPQGAPLGSVAFSGAMYSNLYHEISTAQPTVYTWSGWVRVNESPTTGAIFKYGNVSGGGFGFGIGETVFQSTHTAGTNIVVVSESANWMRGGSVQNLTSWHHYAFTVNGSAFAVWIDGVQFYSSSWTCFTVSPACIYFGGYTDKDRYLPCNMTRCAMWNRALSASEVAQDYADGKNAPTITNGLQHYWPMTSAANYLTDEVGAATLTAGVGGVTISADTPFA